MMKLRYLIAIVLVSVQAGAQSADEAVTARIQLPDKVSANYTDLTVDLYARNGQKQGETLKVSSDLTVSYPATGSIGMLQVRKKSATKNQSPVLLLVAGVYFKQNEIAISALTTVRALFTNEIQDIYSTITQADKPQAEQIIVAMLKEEAARLEQFLQADDNAVEQFAQPFVEEESFKEKANEINAALATAVKSGALGVRAQSPLSEVRKSLEALISCKSNPLTYGTDPAEEQSLQNLLHDEFKRSGDGAVLKRPVKLFDAKVAQIFPGNLGAAPAFAAILEVDMKTLRSNVQATGIDLSECTKDTCEIKVNEKAILLMGDSTLFTGEANQGGSRTLLGCIYP